MKLFTSNFACFKHTAASAGLCLLLAGCNSYSHMTRDDTITPSAGDAVKAAMAIQTVDPWPDYVLDTDTTMDGELALKRVGDYKAGKTKALENVSASGQTGQQ
jgi:hypothetical protein